MFKIFIFQNMRTLLFKMYMTLKSVVLITYRSMRPFALEWNLWSMVDVFLDIWQIVNLVHKLFQHGIFVDQC